MIIVEIRTLDGKLIHVDTRDEDVVPAKKMMMFRKGVDERDRPVGPGDRDLVGGTTPLVDGGASRGHAPNKASGTLSDAIVYLTTIDASIQDRLWRTYMGCLVNLHVSDFPAEHGAEFRALMNDIMGPDEAIGPANRLVEVRDRILSMHPAMAEDRVRGIVALYERVVSSPVASPEPRGLRSLLGRLGPVLGWA